jgi:hypothetical protein
MDDAREINASGGMARRGLVIGTSHAGDGGQEEGSCVSMIAIISRNDASIAQREQIGDSSDPKHGYHGDEGHDDTTGRRIVAIVDQLEMKHGYLIFSENIFA